MNDRFYCETIGQTVTPATCAVRAHNGWCETCPTVGAALCGRPEEGQPETKTTGGMKMAEKKQCSIEGCEREAKTVGLCAAHYYQKLKKEGRIGNGGKARSPKPEARSPKPEARSPKPEARSISPR